MTAAVWTSTQSHISSDTVTKIQEVLGADDPKDKPFFGEEELDTVHRQEQSRGSLAFIASQA